MRQCVRSASLATAVLLLLVALGSCGSSSQSSTTTYSQQETQAETGTSLSDSQRSTSAAKSWKTVVKLSGSETGNSRVFTLHGGRTKLNYSVSSNGGNGLGGAAFYVESPQNSSDQNPWGKYGPITLSGIDGTASFERPAGDYFLAVSAMGASWSAEVVEWR